MTVGQLKVQEDVDNQVHVELIDILYRQIRHMLWAESFAATLILAIDWWYGNQVQVVIWYCYMIFVTGLPRYFLTVKYNQAKPIIHCKKWEYLLAFFLLITGIGWSFAGTILLPANPLNQALVLFLLVGVAAAANPFYSPLKKIYAIFLIPTLLITAIYLIHETTNLHVFTGIALFSFGLLMLITSIFSSNLIEAALQLRFQNSALTDRLIAANISLEQLATHDTLTTLPNRQAFHDQLAKEIKVAKNAQSIFALLFLDLDNFKEVNDSYGHDFGDELLLEVGRRLRQELRANDMASRLGGDEFILLVHQVSSTLMINKIAERICQSMQVPFEVKGQTFKISCSIGISFYPIDGEDEKSLIKHADEAMYLSKNLLRGRFKYYNEKIQQDLDQGKP